MWSGKEKEKEKEERKRRKKKKKEKEERKRKTGTKEEGGARAMLLEGGQSPRGGVVWGATNASPRRKAIDSWRSMEALFKGDPRGEDPGGSSE